MIEHGLGRLSRGILTESDRSALLIYVHEESNQQSQERKRRRFPQPRRFLVDEHRTELALAQSHKCGFFPDRLSLLAQILLHCLSGLKPVL